MTLGELIKYYEGLIDRKVWVLPYSLSHPHSYRGDFSELAFEVTKASSRVEDMLYMLRRADREYAGYKGGMFQMTLDTELHFAEYGEIGEPITEEALHALIILSDKPVKN